MFVVEWSDQALMEIVAIAAYVEERDEAAALRLARELREAGDSLSDFPRRGRKIEAGLHQLSVVYPYLIRYDVADDVVTIVSVRHGAREEG